VNDPFFLLVEDFEGHIMLSKAKAIQSDMVSWRRDFHMHPELGFGETRTAAKIAEIMTGLGYRVRTGVGKTGIVADFGEGTPIVAIRADMDALPIPEVNDTPYCSQNEGVMHACGHDAHVAIALGAAKLLADEKLEGTIRFLFQPAEEVQDEEGLSGATRMIEEGAMDDVDYILALHVDAAVPTGHIELAKGFSGAGVDSFFMKVLGKGGHGATPQRVIDPILISGHVIMVIHSIISRRLWPFDPAVISIGSIHGGQASNVIPDEVELTGTIRFLDKEVQTQIHEELERALEVTRSLGGDYELEIIKGYPAMENNPEVVAVINSVVRDVIGSEFLKEPEPDMGSEDFPYMLEKAPGAMFFLGCEIEGDRRRHHDPRFDIDEDCMPIGAAIFVETVLRYMSQSEK
jgi:amidohydrolase